MEELATIFTQAWRKTLVKRRLLMLFVALFLIGLVTLFFQTLSSLSVGWWHTAIGFVPFFVAIAILGAVGVFLVRDSSDNLSIKEQVVKCAAPMSKAFCLALLLLGAYLVIWMLLVIFFLLKTIPYAGPVLAATMTFAPFLLHMATLLLSASGVALLFFGVPKLAYQERFRFDPLFDLLALGLAIAPFWIFWKFLHASALLTMSYSSFAQDTSLYIVQSFFLMLPIVALATLPVHFFFNVAALTANKKRRGLQEDR